MLSLLSIIPSAESLSFNFEINLPQLPTVGLITFGYPCDSKCSTAASFENATDAYGVGTPYFFNNICVNNLFPAKIPVFRQLTTSTPIPSSAAVECRFR